MSDKPTRIDWEDVRRRLAVNARALEEALDVGPERLAEVYRQRAAELAQPPEQEDASAVCRVLVFALGSERYALDVADVAEVLPCAGVTPVPEGPAALLGVINLHEEIRSVVDLGLLLGLPGRKPAAVGYVVVVRSQGASVVLGVDGLEAVVPLRQDELLSPGPAEAEAAGRPVRAVTRDKVQLLDAGALLAHPLFANGAKRGHNEGRPRHEVVR